MRMSSALSPVLGCASPSSGAQAEVGSGGGERERPIDLVHLSRQTFGDKRLEAELLRLFVRQSEQILASLEGRQLEHSRPSPGTLSARDLLHTLLGSARAVGAASVATVAQQLESERRAAAGEPDELSPDGRERLREAVTQTNRFIAELLETN